MSDLIERLVAMRKAANVGNRELDRLAGITEGHSWLIEHRSSSKSLGNKSNLATGTVMKLAEALGCSLDYLASGKGEPPTDEEIAAAIARARAKLDDNTQLAESEAS